MTEVKICGITNKADALVAAQCGAAALGFIFYPLSPRYIKPENAKKIIRTLPDKVVRTGVFVNEEPENIKKIMEYCALDMIQLHGDESPQYCRQFHESIIIKALELKKKDDIKHALDYDVAAILVDSRQGNTYGGTGIKSNWELACKLRDKKPLILSGGLNAKNVALAIKTVVPAAVDINSGVEISPGIKDHAKLIRLFAVINAKKTVQKKSPLIFLKRKK